VIFEEFKASLYGCFGQNGLSTLLNEENAEKLYAFANHLVETNKNVNLTAITDMNGIIFKHFADCAVLCSHINKGASVIDVGCGAGFPSLPLAILRPDIQITSLDSTAKKINFINGAAQKLSINNITAIVSRADYFAKDHREGFDYATSRAVARLNILCELCLPLVKVGGSFLPLKASKAQEEIDEAQDAIKLLGGEIKKAYFYELAFCGETLERCIAEIAKTSRSLDKYPRMYSQILKKPL